jgi:hypothetical protein
MPDQSTERRPEGLGRLYIVAVGVLGGAVLVDCFLTATDGRLPRTEARD